MPIFGASAKIEVRLNVRHSVAFNLGRVVLGSKSVTRSRRVEGYAAQILACLFSPQKHRKVSNQSASNNAQTGSDKRADLERNPGSVMALQMHYIVVYVCVNVPLWTCAATNRNEYKLNLFSTMDYFPSGRESTLCVSLLWMHKVCPPHPKACPVLFVSMWESPSTFLLYY